MSSSKDTPKVSGFSRSLPTTEIGNRYIPIRWQRNETRGTADVMKSRVITSTSDDWLRSGKHPECKGCLYGARRIDLGTHMILFRRQKRLC